MRLIDADESLKKRQALLSFDESEVIWIHSVSVAPTIDSIHAAGGCYCRECKYQTHDQECGKRWCTRELGCREVRADGQGYCDLGARMDGRSG